MVTTDLSILLSVCTVIGSGIASYVAIRVAIAEIKIEQKNQDSQIEELKKDVKRLERPFFEK